MELLVQVKQYQQNVSLEREKKKNAIYQICLFLKKKSLAVNGGFQMEFVSISRVINHMTCYNSSALIGGKFVSKKILYKIFYPV